MVKLAQSQGFGAIARFYYLPLGQLNQRGLNDQTNMIVVFDKQNFFYILSSNR